MKIKKFIVCGVLAVLAGVAGLLGGCALKEANKDEGSSLAPTIVIDNTRQIKLMSATIAPDDYEAYGVSETALKAYTLTATYAPSYVTGAAVDWSVSFVEPDSEWATGKTATDYIKATPESDGALVAVVECYAAFGADIQVTATSRTNPDVSAICLCVWVHTDDDGGGNIEGGGSTGETEECEHVDANDDGLCDKCSESFSDGDDSGDDNDSSGSGNAGSGSGDGDYSTVEYAQTNAGDMIIYEGGAINEDPSGLSFGDGERVFSIAGIYNPYTLEWNCMKCMDGATWREWAESVDGPSIETDESGNVWRQCGQQEDGTPVYVCIIDDQVCIAIGEDNFTSPWVVAGVGADDVIGFNYYDLIAP